MCRLQLRPVVVSQVLRCLGLSLMVHWTRTSTGQRSFAVYGHRTRNRLPSALRLPELSLSSLKRQLKTHTALPALAYTGCSYVSCIPSSGAIVTVMSSAPTTSVLTQLNVTLRDVRISSESNYHPLQPPEVRSRSIIG